jgi:hypothetical protein
VCAPGTPSIEGVAHAVEFVEPVGAIPPSLLPVAIQHVSWSDGGAVLDNRMVCVPLRLSFLGSQYQLVGVSMFRDNHWVASARRPVAAGVRVSGGAPRTRGADEFLFFNDDKDPVDVTPADVHNGLGAGKVYVPQCALYELLQAGAGQVQIAPCTFVHDDPPAVDADGDNSNVGLVGFNPFDTFETEVINAGMGVIAACSSYTGTFKDRIESILAAQLQPAGGLTDVGKASLERLFNMFNRFFNCCGNNAHMEQCIFAMQASLGRRGRGALAVPFVLL